MRDSGLGAGKAVRRRVSDGCGDMAPNLHEAAWNGDVAEMRRLVAAGADVEEQRGVFGRRPLHVAAHNGHVETMRVLVEELGADKDEG
jgi:ankyrin repeat protein